MLDGYSMTDFRGFLLEEIQKRNMSVLAFSQWLGVTHTTINRLLDDREKTAPSAKTLAILSSKLEMPIETLFSLAYPEEVIRFHDDPEALAMAKKIHKLSPEKRELIKSAIIGFLVNEDAD